MKITHLMRFSAPLMSVASSPACMTRIIGSSNGTIFPGRSKKENVESGIVDFWSSGRLEEPRRQILRPTYFLYFQRRQSDKPSEGDYLVVRSKKLKLGEHDKLLKKFRHKEALVSVSSDKNPENVVAIMEELVTRRTLVTCVSNLDNEELGFLLSFMLRHTTVPRYSGLLMDLMKKVLEIWAQDIRTCDALRGHIENLKRSVEEERRIQQSLQEIQGIISPLLRIARRR